MSLIDSRETIPEEIPADPITQIKLHRSLLYIALAGLLAPCGLCWYSTRVPNIEHILIPGLLGIILFIYTIFIIYKRELNQDLTPPLWRVIFVFILLLGAVALAVIWLTASIGWHHISGPAILVLGAWSFFLAGRRVWESWSFFHLAVFEENDQAELKMISIDGGHPIHPELAYCYAGKYRGQITNNRIRNKSPEIRQAIKDGKFRVVIKYLPKNPRVHRFLGWKILP